MTSPENDHSTGDRGDWRPALILALAICGAAVLFGLYARDRWLELCGIAHAWHSEPPGGHAAHRQGGRAAATLAAPAPPVLHALCGDPPPAPPATAGAPAVLP